MFITCLKKETGENSGISHCKTKSNGQDNINKCQGFLNILSALICMKNISTLTLR